MDGAVIGVAHRPLVRRRPAPQVVVHRLGRLLRAADLADARPQLVAQAAGQGDLAQLAGVDEGDGVAQTLLATALRAGLANAVEFAGGLDDAAAFADVVADRLLDVNVLAGLHGPDGGQGVPVVGRGNADGVNRLVFENLADVLDVFGGEALLLLGVGHGRADDALINVADGGDDAVELLVAGVAVNVATALT